MYMYLDTLIIRHTRYSKWGVLNDIAKVTRMATVHKVHNIKKT